MQLINAPIKDTKQRKPKFSSGRSRRQKGRRREKQAAEELERLGFEATGDIESIDIYTTGLLKGFHIEVKGWEKADMTSWLKQAETDAKKRKKEYPIIMYKQNYGRWAVIMSSETFAKLILR